MINYSVAVIISCYNSARFIRKAIDSVLAQDYEPLEVIVVNDGSTDETGKILETYSSRIQILCHHDNANLGQPASINLGIQQTKADLIAFLDHDDVWYPIKLSEQVKIFQKYPDVGLVYTNVYDIDENDSILYKRLPDDFKELNMPGRLLLNNYIVPASVMVRKTLFEHTGLFNTNLKVGNHDHDLWLKLIEISKFYYLPNCFAGYRRHSTQLNKKKEMWELAFVVLRDACKRYPYTINVVKKRFAVLNFRLGQCFMEEGRFLRALIYLVKSGILDPIRALKVLLGKERLTGPH